MPDDSAPAGLDAAQHRRLGVDLFNHVWTLLDKAERTPADIDEMIHAAHASRFHWSRAGNTANLARGEWQCARVYSVLGRAEPATWHARRCVDLAEEAAARGEAEVWDLPAAYEAVARALVVGGDPATAKAWAEKARAALAAVNDADDREVIEQYLADLPLD